MTLVCLCGGIAYTRDELLALAAREHPEDAAGWQNAWRSLLGPFDLYCSNDDEVLTDLEALEVRGLRTPCHDVDLETLAWDGQPITLVDDGEREKPT